MVGSSRAQPLLSQSRFWLALTEKQVLVGWIQFQEISTLLSLDRSFSVSLLLQLLLVNVETGTASSASA